MDLLSQWGMAMGTAWLAGINLYATAFTLGMLQHFGYVTLPGDMRVLGSWWLIGFAGVLYLIEFVADKIPVVDSIWDAVHTFIRVPAGGVLAASAFAHLDPSIKMLALLAGGGLALSAHGTKAAVRLSANTSPEPFSNIALSLGEDAIAAGGALLGAFHPLVLLSIVAVAVVISFFLIRLIARGVRRLFGRRAVSAVP